MGVWHWRHLRPGKHYYRSGNQTNDASLTLFGSLAAVGCSASFLVRLLRKGDVTNAKFCRFLLIQ
ncbi:hypothetical protein KCP76_21320 [Salmonella enterica subsp. enterica serovar Weltevreden]|nr:hypothetical protein KCP76_21320 [Salmonella enterica subsp. enterica serovar Weltevreden]